MAKSFETIVYDRAQCKRELQDFAAMLKSSAELSERKDILPFFKNRKQLSAMIGTFDARIWPVTELSHEFSFLGDFSADLLVGNRAKKHFLAVEFEDGRTDSIFKKLAAKSTTEWSQRFDHGFSQLVDWFCTLDDYKKIDKFKSQFGNGHITFSGLLIIGRNAGVSEADRIRLAWRTEKVRVDSHSISCVTFDDLYEYLADRLAYYPKAKKFEKGK